MIEATFIHEIRDLEVLKDINAEVKKGEVISVIGPSGTGKSTFLRCLNLLETPTGGEIFIDGEPLLEKGTDVPRNPPQNGHGLPILQPVCAPDRAGKSDVGSGDPFEEETAEADRKAMELLKMVGLGEKAYNFPDELSGGHPEMTIGFHSN